MGKGKIFDYYPYSKHDAELKLYKDPSFNPAKVFEEKFGTQKEPGF